MAHIRHGVLKAASVRLPSMTDPMHDNSDLSRQVSSGGVGRVKVLLPLPLAGAYDYRAPPGLLLAPGQFVTVPLGRRQATGVVWDNSLEEKEGAVSEDRLKDVIGVASALTLPRETRRLVDWVAGYTTAPLGAVLRMAMSVPTALDPPKPRIAYAIGEGGGDLPSDVRMTPARQRILALLRDGPPRTQADIVHETGVTAGVVKKLAEIGAILPVKLPVERTARQPDPDSAGPALSPPQRDAAATLIEKMDAFSVTLVDGVTGSGKTEVYFEAIAEALRRGRQALVLLPEIALGAQWLQRFEARFGARPTQWHSELTPVTRRAAWRAIAQGRARVVVGARSALFLPFPDLGLIVVDEEHDGAFKQEDGVAYHARDMAIVRAQIGGFPAILASATPSLETIVNVEADRYARVQLPTRHGGADLPDIHLIDLRADPPERQCWLSPPLRDALARTLAAEQQSLLFLNRRGYAPLTLCRACGHRLECPNCTAWLVEHRFRGRLQCHHCGLTSNRPDSCPACEAEGALVACGPGVERVAEEVMALFPDARMSVVTSDNMRNQSDAAEFIRTVSEHEVDILIGTQIVAKGHHFPNLTLVGVIDADLGLAGGDLRAAERTYQLLHQVAGRAGRAERPGAVYLQTYRPDHPVMQAMASGDRDGFLSAEAQARRVGHWPPFGRLAALIVSGRDEQAVDAVARELARRAPTRKDVRTLGPAPAPLAMLRGRHRRRLLLKTERGVAVPPLVRDWLARVKAPSTVRIQVDVDPYSFM
jgi:primosomal protein N' (replication factor Y) (superfamily II helicase)